MTEDRRMTVAEHLHDLRRTILIGGGAWAIATAIAFIYNGALLWFLLRPLRAVLTHVNHATDIPIFTSPTAGFTIPFKVALCAGFVMALPIILWQVWDFVSPALRKTERRFALPLLVSGVALFLLGAVVAYLVMPIGLSFLVSFPGSAASYLPDVEQYISFFLLLVMVFGLTFELPIVVILLGLLGIVSSKWLRGRRPMLWVGLAFIALIVTPGSDPFTPAVLFVPLVVLLEASMLVLDKGLHK